MNQIFKSLRNTGLTLAATISAIAWGIAEFVALQRARLGGPPRR